MAQSQAPGGKTAGGRKTRNRNPVASKSRSRSKEQKQTEAKLLEHELTLQGIYRAAPIGIGLVTNRELGWVNDRLCEMLDRERNELEGKSARILYPSDEEYERVGELKHPLVQKHGTGSIETKFQHKDGHTIDVFLSSSAIVPGDLSAGLIFTVMDLTEKKRVERERSELEEHMRHSQKMEAIGQLAGGIAHDFNNLLQVISGNIEILKSDLPATPTAQETLTEISQASNRATSLVRQLLTFSRRVAMKFDTLNLNDIIVDLLRMLERILGEDIHLRIQKDPDLKTVLADPGQVEQILTNLCVNARDSMPNGGTILIKTSNIVLDADFCLTNPDARTGEFVHISVSDTGVGIPYEMQSRIFEPFFTTKDIGEGTGLGLATAYAIARKHNGFMGMVSEPGKGTTLSLYLPVDTTTQTARIDEPPDLSSQADGGSETILLAEDDSQVRELARKILDRAGYRVLQARDGEEAIRIFRKYADKIDLAVLDVIMPRQNGHAVYLAITAQRPDLPVFFCSGYSYSELESRHPKGNKVQLIQKPYNRDTLLRAVRQALQGARS